MSNPAKLALMGGVQKSTHELLEANGLKGWKVLFDRSLHRAGTCRYFEKEIVFSIHFMENAEPEERRNTILHEVAHAIAGHSAGHGEEWAAVHRSLGGNAQVVTLMPQVLSTHTYFLWVGTCSHCGYRTGLEDAPDGVWICRACDPSLPKHERIFTWTKDEEPMAPEQIGVEYLSQYRSLFELV